MGMSTMNAYFMMTAHPVKVSRKYLLSGGTVNYHLS